jgi:hypothetical protein
MAIMDPGFYHKLLEVSSEVQMKPEDLLNVMSLESGVDPTAHNANGNASGLIQFMPSTLKGLGYQGSHSDFRQLSAIDQLDYVKKYIMNNMKYNGGPFTSAAQYYVANFLPVALQLPGIKSGDPDTIIVAKNPDHPHLPGVSTHMESVYYNANPVLDANKDGVITYGDIETILNRVAAGSNFKSALAQLQNSTGYQPSKIPQNMVATNQPPSTNLPPDNDVMSLLNNYLQEITSSERYSKKLYKQYLPKHYFVLKIDTSNYTDAVEFSRIISLALDEELLTNSFVHTNGQQVEVEGFIYGSQEKCAQAINQLAVTMAQMFQERTEKIGAIRANTHLIMNNKSSYQPLTVKDYLSQHKKFLLKFKDNKNGN